METKKLDNYISRSQVREYLQYILDSGTSDIVESPDGVHFVEPVNIRLGSTINSVKLFHLHRQTNFSGQATQGAVYLSSNDTKPEMPTESVGIGIFYMSKFGRDYSGDLDRIGSYEYVGDIGDVVCLDPTDWENLSLGKTSTGINYRLFVFWKAV